MQHDTPVQGLMEAGDRGGKSAAEVLGMLASVARELRTPLQELAVSAEVLASDAGALTRERQRELAAGIHERTVGLQCMLENLLCELTIRQGRLSLQRRAVDVASVLDEVRPLATPVLEQRKQYLRVRVTRGMQPALGDGRRIGQVLVNLILNASKYGAAGGAVEVSLRPAGRWVRVAVADRGPGLPPGSEAALFEPFYRAPEAARAGAEGLGLGLAIVKAIVAAHGGRVGAATRRGGGARFWFDLPAAPSSSAATPPVPGTPGGVLPS